MSWETDRNLDDLIKLIDNEEIVEDTIQSETQQNNDSPSDWESNENEWENIESWDDENSIQGPELENSEVSQEEPKERWFFARLFWRDQQDEEVDTQDTMTWSSSTGITSSWVVTNESQNAVQDKLNITGDLNDTSITWDKIRTSYDKNIVKSTSEDQIKIYVDPTKSYPGENIQTAVGKIYSVWVTNLRLNNKYFDTTLAYMKEGERVQQLTNENSYGCFQVEVIRTWKQWYVCKKYLTDETSEVSLTVEKNNIKENDQTSKTMSSPVAVLNTPVGSYYKIALENTNFFDVVLERFTLDKWDVLKQVASADKKTGCVEMKVVGSSTWMHDGKSVSICSPDMVISYTY